MAHIDINEIAEYVSGHMEPGKEFFLECHLFVCGDCAQKAARFRYVQEHLEELEKDFSLEKAAETAAAAALLEKAANANVPPELSKALASWIERFRQGTRIVSRLAIDAAERAVSATRETLADLSSPFDGLPCLDPAPATRARGFQTRGAYDGPIDRRKDPDGRQIEIYKTDDAIHVTISPAPEGGELPLLWLCPKSEDRASVVKRTRKPEGEDCLVAEFALSEFGDPDDYVLLMEPTA